MERRVYRSGAAGRTARRTGNRENYYVEGSAVRQNAVPERQPSRKREAEKRKVRRTGNISYPAAAAKAERSLYFDKGYTVVLIIAAIILIVSFGLTVNFQSRVSERERNILTLQEELQKIEERNRAAEDELEKKFSLDRVFQVATKELGMVYSREGQILYYNRADEDYVKQMRDVPEAK